MRYIKWIDGAYLTVLVVACLLVYGAWLKLTFEPRYFDKHYMSFGKFYSVGRIVFSPDRARLYDPYYQRQRLSEFVDPKVLPEVQELGGIMVFPKGFAEHPPHFIMMFAPFSVFPPVQALWVYTALCTVAGMAGLLWLTRVVGTMRLAQVLALSVGAAASFPSRYALMLGQPAWLVMGLIAAYFALWFRGNGVMAGLLLSLMTIKPQYPIFYGLPALMTKRWKIVLAAICGGLAVLALCCAVVGVDTMKAYFPLIAHGNSSSAYSDNDNGMPSVRGIVSTNIDPTLGIRIGGVCTLVALLSLAWMWWRTEKRGMDARWAFCVTLLCSIVFSPHVFRYDMMFLVLAPALTLNSLSLGWSRAAARENWEFTLWRYLWITYPLVTFVYGVFFIGRLGLDAGGRVNNVLEFATNLLLLFLAARLWWRGGYNLKESEPSVDSEPQSK